MSLVYEALQKAAKEKNRFASPPPAPIAIPSPVPTPVAAPVAPKRSPVVWIVGGSLVALTVVVVAGAILVFKKPDVTSVPVALPAEVAAPSLVVETSPVVPAPVAERPAANTDRFKLTGIMKMGEEYSAIINGHVVAREQFVDGAVVKAVESDRVTLTVNGRDVVVRLF